jgi:class 3 adenylate cyclase/predicted ATPase
MAGVGHAVPLAQDSLDSSDRLHENRLDSTGTPGMDVSTWLRDLGLEDYAQAFQAHHIDAEVLPRLTAEDLIALGITSVGHRRRLLDAIAALDQGRAAAAARTLEAERRQLTVLFCDLVGSTELAARLDPEDLRELMGAYQAACADVIGGFEGHVARLLGDGVLAYFGWPRAHEDDAERAVRAGLQLVQDVARLEPRAGVRLQARAGVATGHVVVGDLISEGISDKDAVSGDAPNVAARLQAIAVPGSVVISQATRRLVGGLFELADLGPQCLKGFAEPLSAFKVEGQGRANGRFEARNSAALTPLVGRNEEIALLLRRWEQARDGEGQVVLLSGEPGIGKSRIVRELLARLGGEPHVHLLYQCSPYHTNSALYPIVAQLERAAGVAPGDDRKVTLAKLEGLLSQAIKRLDEAVPLLAALLGLPVGGRYPNLNLSPQRQKQRTLEVLTEQLAGLARDRPVLELYEDVHWVDPSTLELLDLLVARVRALPVLVVLTYRPEFSPPWSGQAHITYLPLNRLGRRQGAAMVGRVAGGKALPAEVLEQIVARTDGVPLFVEELTKTVLESGLLVDAGDHYELAGPLPPLVIPTTLHASLTARLDRLPAAKEVAQIGAVIGREFSHDLLAAVAPISATQLGDALEQLVSSELIFRRGVPPEAAYTFKHALVQEAAYQSLLKSRREQLHARIARVLEERFPETAATQPELLAQHYTAANLHDQAMKYWHAAGQRALDRCAALEAVDHLEKALELLDWLSQRPQQWQSRDWWKRELKITTDLGWALIATLGSSASRTRNTFDRALELCRQLNEPAPPRVLFGLFLCHLVRGELGSALGMAQELRCTARQQEDKLVGHRALGTVYLFLGSFRLARLHLKQVLALYDPEQHRSLASSYLFDPCVVAASYIAIAELALGYPEPVLQVNKALERARELDHEYSLAHAQYFACLFYHLLRDHTEVQENFKALGPLCDKAHFRIYAAGARVLHGWAQIELGQTVEGLAHVDQGLDEWRPTEAKLLLPCLLTSSAEAYCKCEKTDQVLSTLDNAAKTEECWFVPELDRRRGEVLLKLPGAWQPEAEACFHQALAVASDQGARLWELRAATSLARLWRDQGKRAQAHDLLAPIYGWFTEGFDTADLKDAKALLDELA